MPRGRWRGLLLSVALAGLVAGWAPLAAAQPQPPPSSPPPPSPPSRELVIGTKSAPPFAMKDKDGHWTGLSIALWQRIADQLHLRYRLVERTLPELISQTQSGKLDGAIAAMSVTAKREKVIDFSQPYYTAGLGIATSATGSSGVWPLLRALVSPAFAKTIAGLALMLLAVGVVIWLAERRRNRQFGGGVVKGLGSGFWWSAVTMTTVGYGDKAPVSLLGRLVAIFWMFASVILISSVTAAITTALTTAQITGVVHGPNDLSSARVGTVVDSAAGEYLDERRIVYDSYPTLEDGLKALERGDIDALVYDRPLLDYVVKQDFGDSLRVLAAVFDRQNYAMVLPQNDPLRERIDQALLTVVQSDWWKRSTFDLLGHR